MTPQRVCARGERFRPPLAQYQAILDTLPRNKNTLLEFQVKTQHGWKPLTEKTTRETQARIDQYEMAFRMQASVPELTDLSDEPESIWEMYGPKAKEPRTLTVTDGMVVTDSAGDHDC